MPYNGSWRVEEDLFFYQYNIGSSGKTQTTFFNENTWYYTNLSTKERYTAVRVSVQPSVIPIVSLGQDTTPTPSQSKVINVSQLAGYWKAMNNQGASFQLNIYPDQRLYTVNGENAFNASWTVQGDRFYEYFDYVDEPAVLKTTFFDGKTWKYESFDNGHKYTATKISSTPQKMVVQQAKPNTKNNNTIQKEKKDAGRYSPSSSICYCCSGTHKKNCSSCDGQGGYNERISFERYNPSTERYELDYRNEWRNCTADGCNYGKMDCDCCNKRSDELFNPNSMDKVPHDETMIGSWNGNGGDVWTFFAEGGYDYKVFQVISGGQKLIGSWVIEDGLMKLQFTFDKDWEKYSFSFGWTAERIMLTNQSDYGKIGLTRRK
jgi:hypothetical protein